MAALKRYDSSEYQEASPGSAEHVSGYILGILLVGMICGTTAAITAFYYGASVWIMLLAYSLIGSMSALLVPALQAILLSGKRKYAAKLPPARPERY